ncbi:MAG: DUF1778 domain-containing protein [Oscillatoria princeps RMCB-10]|jgi:uncharacterized protein (DUF1778 family)|nr:DUF1778 domain-containing protein [Oscillatoria princeps RMCB-10]
MTAPAQSQETTIELKLSEDHKKTLEKAAAKRCMTLSEYLLDLALNAATEEIPEPESIVLSERDWEIFVSALENPPELNPRLKAAIKRYREEYEKE